MKRGGLPSQSYDWYSLLLFTSRFFKVTRDFHSPQLVNILSLAHSNLALVSNEGKRISFTPDEVHCIYKLYLTIIVGEETQGQGAYSYIPYTIHRA